MQTIQNFESAKICNFFNLLLILFFIFLWFKGDLAYVVNEIKKNICHKFEI